MSSPERSLSYIYSKPISQYMRKEILLLDRRVSTSEATRILQDREHDDIIVTESGRPVGIVTA